MSRNERPMLSLSGAQPPFAHGAGRKYSLRAQLIAWNVLTLAVLFAVLGGVIHYMVRTFMMTSVNRELLSRVRHSGERPPPPGREGSPPRKSPQEDRDPLGMGRPDGPHGPNRPNGPLGPGSAQQAFPGGGPPDQGLPEQGPGGPPPGQDPFPPESPGQYGHPEPQGVGSADSRYRPQRFDLSGQRLAPLNTDKLWDSEGFQKAKDQNKEIYSDVTIGQDAFRVLSFPFPPDSPMDSIIQAPYPLAEVNLAVANLDRALLMLTPVCLICAAIGGALLTGRVLQPVRQMTRSAEHIGAHNFAERLPVLGNDEFSELAETFNRLLTRQEMAFQEQERALEQQRRFTADASHELKTPLTVIRGNAGMALSSPQDAKAYRQTLQEIDNAAKGMSHLVHDLLLLARSDSGQLGRNVIELLLQEILTQAKSRVSPDPHAPISLRVEDIALSVIGNEMELVRLFSNLLDNAVRYTPQNGKVTVTARRRGANGEWVEIKVADTGIGIASEDLPHLGERFFRADSSRARPSGGTGLGLSICKGIVEAHGGTMTFASAPGVGTTVTVYLPGSAPNQHTAERQQALER